MRESIVSGEGRWGRELINEKTGTAFPSHLALSFYLFTLLLSGPSKGDLNRCMHAVSCGLKGTVQQKLTWVKYIPKW